MMHRYIPLILAQLLVACAQEEAPRSPSSDGSRGVTQGGAQDIGRFRQILDAGGIPGSETLDDVGFFAEHAVDLPPADCGASLCVHPMLAVAPRFDGGNWTMAFVALNSALDPATLERPPVHLAFALERSERTRGSWSGIVRGLEALVRELRPEDRISVVIFGDGVGVSSEHPPSIPDLGSALLEAQVEPSNDAPLYEGLANAGLVTEGFAGARRIVLVTSGQPGGGITDVDRVVALGEALARDGAAISVAVTGEDVDARLPDALGEIGAGNVYYATDVADLEALLTVEGQTTLVPIATDFELDLSLGPAYSVGRVYGARGVEVEPGVARITSPALFLGHRTGAQDVSGGRRGGGGGLFVELVARDSALAREVGPDHQAFEVDAFWTDLDGASERTSGAVINPLIPGQNPDMNWPHFSDPARGKAFMMLNMYIALKATLDFYEGGDCSRAKGVIDMMEPTVVLFQEQYDDPDIWADLELLRALRANLEAGCRSAQPIEPRVFPAGCFFL